MNLLKQIISEMNNNEDSNMNTPVNISGENVETVSLDELTEFYPGRYQGSARIKVIFQTNVGPLIGSIFIDYDGHNPHNRFYQIKKLAIDNSIQTNDGEEIPVSVNRDDLKEILKDTISIDDLFKFFEDNS